jgi:hypothetical protein
VGIRVNINESAMQGVVTIFERIEQVAQTHAGRPEPEVLAALERIYVDLNYGPTDGLDLREIARQIAGTETS